MKELWKDIKGYEGLYMISSYGRVYSFYSKDFLTLTENKYGYLQVNLYKNSKKKSFKVHRLVSEAFIPNPDCLSCINHRDEDKTNNKIDNLEWCTYKYNNNYGTKNTRANKTKKDKNIGKGENHPMYGKEGPMKGRLGGCNSLSRKVYCITTNRFFNGIREAEREYGVSHSSISACCKGKRKSAGKHPITGEKLKWKYIDNK